MNEDCMKQATTEAFTRVVFTEKAAGWSQWRKIMWRCTRADRCCHAEKQGSWVIASICQEGTSLALRSNNTSGWK